MSRRISAVADQVRFQREEAEVAGLRKPRECVRGIRRRLDACRERQLCGHLIDSEEPVVNIERTWEHLQRSDNWQKPRGATDDQVLFMTTSMETWVVADRDALRVRYAGRGLSENALPPLNALESRRRGDVFDRLRNATGRRYKKGDESFKVFGTLNPATLEEHLPSFNRARRILNQKLG